MVNEVSRALLKFIVHWKGGTHTSFELASCSAIAAVGSIACWLPRYPNEFLRWAPPPTSADFPECPIITGKLAS